MIDQLRGTCIAAGPTWVVVDLHGLALRCVCTPATAAAVRIGEQASVHTTMVVREDSMTLYGFGESSERDAFDLLLTTSGIGPKLAMAVLSVLSPADLVAAIATEDLARLVTVPGIARKGAQKLVLELKDKIATLGVDAGPARRGGVASGQWRDQVVEGLQGLGWSLRDAEAACDAVADLAQAEPQPSVAVLMRAALNSLAR